MRYPPVPGSSCVSGSRDLGRSRNLLSAHGQVHGSVPPAPVLQASKPRQNSAAEHCRERGNGRARARARERARARARERESERERRSDRNTDRDRDTDRDGDGDGDGGRGRAAADVAHDRAAHWPKVVQVICVGQHRTGRRSVRLRRSAARRRRHRRLHIEGDGRARALHRECESRCWADHSRTRKAARGLLLQRRARPCDGSSRDVSGPTALLELLVRPKMTGNFHSNRADRLMISVSQCVSESTLRGRPG